MTEEKLSLGRYWLNIETKQIRKGYPNIFSFVNEIPFLDGYSLKFLHDIQNSLEINNPSLKEWFTILPYFTGFNALTDCSIKMTNDYIEIINIPSICLTDLGMLMKSGLSEENIIEKIFELLDHETKHKLINEIFGIRGKEYLTVESEQITKSGFKRERAIDFYFTQKYINKLKNRGVL